MIFALVSVALAAVCSGTATVLQALAARRAPVSTGLDTSFVRRLVRSPAYAAALVGGWWLGNRTFPLPLPLAETAKVAAATLVMALALLPTRPLTGAPALALQVGLGATVYLAALLLLNVSGSRRHMARLFGRVKAYVAERQHTATLAKGDN